jgi:hypothetical protein
LVLKKIGAKKITHFILTPVKITWGQNKMGSK